MSSYCAKAVKAKLKVQFLDGPEIQISLEASLLKLQERELIQLLFNTNQDC